MGTNSDTKDDIIIDLTEIVETDAPHIQTSDFTGESAADPQSPINNFNQELDDLLQEEPSIPPQAEPSAQVDEQPLELLDIVAHEETVPVDEHILDLTDVASQVEAPTAPTPSPEVDCLEDILISEPDSAPEGDTSLDFLLEGDIQFDFPDPPSTATPATPEPKKESEPLSFDPEPMLEPETSVASPQAAPALDPVSEKEPFETHAETSEPVDLTDDLFSEAQSMAAEQASDLHSEEAEKDTPAQEAATHDLKAIVARLDALEDRAAGFEHVTLDQSQVLAVLPDNPEDVPYAAALRADILKEAGRMAEEKLEAASTAPQLEALRRTVDALSSRLTVVEDRSTEPMRIETDQILAALPDNPEDVPYIAALRADILEEAGRMAEEKLETASATPQLEALRRTVDALSSRLTLMENRAAEPARVEAGQILAALPDNPEDVPYAAALRANILEEVNERMAASLVGVDELHQTMDALQDRLTTLSDSQDRLASTQNAALVQDLETELHALRETVLRQENALLDLQKRLTAREQEIASLRESEAALRNRILETERAQEETGNSLKTDLQKFIEDQVPGAAAKIIREEIQKLLQSMDA